MINRPFPWLIIGFFTALLITGIFTYKDYGIPCDEMRQVEIASLNHRYIFQHDPALLTFDDRYYGVVFELPYLWITTHLPVQRHLLIFLTFFAGSIFFYKMAKKLFRSQGWALLASALLTLTPRIFADSFYNSKDVPQLVITVVGIYILIVSVDHLRMPKDGKRRPYGWVSYPSSQRR